jgi:hypothetical protein
LFAPAQDGEGVAVVTNQRDGVVEGVPPINLLAGIIKPGARKRPISPAWDRKQQILTFGSHRSWSRGSTLGAAGSECLPSRTATIVYMIEQFLKHHRQN